MHSCGTCILKCISKSVLSLHAVYQRVLLQGVWHTNKQNCDWNVIVQNWFGKSPCQCSSLTIIVVIWERILVDFLLYLLCWPTVCSVSWPNMFLLQKCKETGLHTDAKKDKVGDVQQEIEMRVSPAFCTLSISKNRTRDLSACSTVPQPTAPPRAQISSQVRAIKWCYKVLSQ